MSYGTRKYATLSVEKRLEIGKEITKLREVEKLSWLNTRASFRNISTNTARKYMKEYKDSLTKPRKSIKKES